MPKPKKSPYHDDLGNPLKFVTARVGKTDHQAYLLEGGPESTVCTVRWSSNDGIEVVLTCDVDFEPNTGRRSRSRKQVERYQPPSPSEPQYLHTQKKQKIEPSAPTQPYARALHNDSTEQSTTAPRKNTTTNKPSKKKPAEKKSASNKKPLQDISDSDSDSPIKLTPSMKKSNTRTPPTEKKYVPGYDDSDQSSTSSSSASDSEIELLSKEITEKKEEEKPKIKPARRGLRERKRNSYDNDYLYSTNKTLPPKLNVMASVECTINDTLVEKAEEEMMPYLNKHGNSILLSKSDQFIGTIVMESDIKTCELLVVCMRKLNHSHPSVIQKLFDFHDPELSPIRRIFLRWLPYAITHMKNKRFTIDMKIQARKYQYAEKAEESLACEILYFIRTIDFGNNQLFMKSQKDLGIDFVTAVNEAKEIANEYLIRPLLDASSYIKEYINSLKLGVAPPVLKKKKSKPIKKAQEKTAPVTPISSVTDVSLPEPSTTPEPDTSQGDNAQSAVIELESVANEFLV